MFFLIFRACTPEIKAPTLQRRRVDNLEEARWGSSVKPDGKKRPRLPQTQGPEGSRCRTSPRCERRLGRPARLGPALAPHPGCGGSMGATVTGRPGG